MFAPPRLEANWVLRTCSAAVYIIQAEHTRCLCVSKPTKHFASICYLIQNFECLSRIDTNILKTETKIWIIQITNLFLEKKKGTVWDWMEEVFEYNKRIEFDRLKGSDDYVKIENFRELRR